MNSTVILYNVDIIDVPRPSSVFTSVTYLVYFKLLSVSNYSGDFSFDLSCVRKGIDRIEFEESIDYTPNKT